MLNRTAHVLGLFSQKYIINMHTKGMLKWWSITEILDIGRFAWCHRFSLYLTFHLWPDGSPRTARHRLVTWFDNVPQKGGRRGEGGGTERKVWMSSFGMSLLSKVTHWSFCDTASVITTLQYSPATSPLSYVHKDTTSPGQKLSKTETWWPTAAWYTGKKSTCPKNVMDHR